MIPVTDTPPLSGRAIVSAAFFASLLSGPGVIFFMMAGDLAARISRAPNLAAMAGIAAGPDGLVMTLLSPLLLLPLMIVPALFGFVPTLLAVAGLTMLARRYPAFRSYNVWIAAGGLFGAALCPAIFSMVSGSPPTPLGHDDLRTFAGLGAVDGALCAAVARRLLRQAIRQG